ncbi:MAG: 4-hydroxy-tetrahydrodipicolinate synthase [Candidatus Bostrichicola ureolyticus]|nr:MAG: 4-hydroxy-tetrahydrodipicolinate synthase [Candidatus Bostrichicola ureolyticus]
MLKQNLKGTGVALVTPFDEKKSIDFNNLEKLINYVNENGVDYLVILGTTGEPTSLNKDEKNEVIKFIKSVNNNHKPMILGIGGNNTEMVIRQIKEQTNLYDFQAILSVVPYYNRPTQEGIYQHFKTIAENTEVNIIIYNVPLRTSSNILPETVLRLANEFDNIIGIKEASGNLTQIFKIIKQKPEGFYVISGDDSLVLPIIFSGGDGIISVLAQGFPKHISNMVSLASRNMIKESLSIFYELEDMIEFIFEEGNPTGIKTLLKIIGICKNEVRLPLVEGTKKLYQKIFSSYERIINTLKF